MKHPRPFFDLRQWLQALALLETLKAQTVAPWLDFNAEQKSFFVGRNPGFFFGWNQKVVTWVNSVKLVEFGGFRKKPKFFSRKKPEV